MTRIYKKATGLPAKDVVKIITDTLVHFGLDYPYNEIRQNFRADIPVPVIVENKEVTVWIDKYYVAYSMQDEIEVHYLYITRRHLNEEKSEKHSRVVGKSFAEAREQMEEKKRGYAVFPLPGYIS